MVENFPSNIGRYELSAKIGSGAMGAIYRGVDPVIDRPIAVKIIRTDLLDTRQKDEYRTRFHQEVRAAGRCIHPGIVTIYDYGEWEGNPFIVMEYLEGQVLQHLLAKGPISVEQSVGFAMQLLDALSHAHERGVVHRDMKPGNIILGVGSRLKITDFGVALIETGSLTSLGALLGTPSYMAPEQANGAYVDHRADLFSVGIILYRMVTGRSPYGEDSFAAVLRKVADTDPIDVSAVDEISPLLGAVVALALRKNVSGRFQSAEEFAHALMTVCSNPLQDAFYPAGDEDQEKGADLSSYPVSSVGPVADRPVARAEKKIQVSSELADVPAVHVAEKLPAPALPSSQLPVRGSPVEPVPLSPEFLKMAQTLLTSFIGPISGIVIRQSLFDLSTPEEFIELLALHIKADEERSQFQERLRILMSMHGLPGGEGG